MKNLSFVALALLLMGCAARRDLAAFQPAASAPAIVRWQGRDISLVSDAIFARSASGAVLVRLYKQSPAPLGEFRLEPDGYLSASQGGRKWAGDSASVPSPLRTWVMFLTTYQGADKLPPGAREIHTAVNRVAYAKEGGKLKSLSVINTDNAETISALFR